MSQNLCDLLKHPRGLEEWELFVTCLGLVFFHLLRISCEYFPKKGWNLFQFEQSSDQTTKDNILLSCISAAM